MNNNSEIGQRYAKALFELSAESKSLDKTEKDLLSVHSLIAENNQIFLVIKSSSTLQITSTIAFPIPKIFILCFLCFDWFFSIRITSSTNFTS